MRAERRVGRMSRIKVLAIVGGAIVLAAAFGAAKSGATLPLGIGLPVVQGPKLDVSSTRVAFDALRLVGRGTDPTGVSGNGGSLRVSAGYRIRSSGLGSDTAAMPEVTLEQRIGSGAWTESEATVASTKGAPFTALTPPHFAAGAQEAVQYRFAFGTAVSSPVTVTYENQASYTGMAKTIYEYAAPYCSTTAVHVEDLGGTEAGDYRTGALLIRIDSSVGRTTEVDPVNQRAVALHECSHERQWVNYGRDGAGYAAMKAAAARQFFDGSDGADPVEHAADCGALALNPGGYLGYGGSCTPTELAAGRRLLLGERY